jgi:O-antigen ligase
MLLHSRHGRKLAFPAVGVVAVAAMLSGSRGAVVYCAISAVVLAAAFLWGAPWRWRLAHRLWKAIRRFTLVAVISLATFVFFFPTAIGSRWAFYSETLSPESPTSELGWRAWDYPIQNLMLAFTDPNWIVGNGIGTASLGVQYVSQFLGERPPGIGVENGYGTLIVELGILGLVLWLVWTTALLIAAWKIVRSLKETPLFPIGFAIFWFIFILLVPFTYGGFQAFENYVYNAYLWLLIGVLFRLPTLLVGAPGQIATVAPVASRPRWFLH